MRRSPAAARGRRVAGAVLGVMVLLHALAALLVGAVYAEAPSDATEVPAVTAEAPDGTGATPAAPTETPAGVAATPSGVAGTPAGTAETPAAAETPAGPTETPAGSPQSPGKIKGSAHPKPEGVLALGKDDEPVTVDADSLTYDREADTLHAKGDVMVTSGSSVLAADQVDLDRKTGKANAVGQVVLEDPEGRLRAENATFFLEDETGFLEQGEVYMPQTRFQITGTRIEKGIGQSYHIWNGTLTTCQCEDGSPDWSVTGDEIDISLGGFGTLHDGTFKIKDTPVLYLPYGAFPVQRDRQSGFLFPRFGYTNSRGFQYLQPYYWAIDKSSDATFATDVETARRLGVLGEYRYLLAPNAGGDLTATYFNEQIGGSTADDVNQPLTLADPTVPQNRGSLIGYIQQPGPDGSRFYIRPFLVSDTSFLRNMNVLTNLPYENILSTTRRYTTSTIGLANVWDWGLFKAEGAYYQDLIQKQSRVPEPLPRINFQARDSLFNSGLLLRLNAEFVNYYRAPLAAGPRFDFAPEAQVPYRIGPYAYGNLRVVGRETDYYLFHNDIPVGGLLNPTDGATPTPGNQFYATRNVARFQSREIVQVMNDLESEVARVYDVDGLGAIKRLKHTIEPFLGYAYTPIVGQDDLPLYDSTDRFRARNTITYGVTSRLLAKVRGGGLSVVTGGAPPGDSLGNELVGDQPYGPPAPPTVSGDSKQAVEDESIQELARATLSQSYEISQPITPGQNFSGVGANLRLTPVSFFGAQGTIVYAVENPRLSFATAGINLTDPRPVAGPDDTFLPELRPVNSLSVYYQFTGATASGTTTTEPSPTPTPGSVENLNVAATYRITNNFGLSYLGRYDVIANRFLENWAGFRLISSCDCWMVDVAFVDRFNPNETGVRVLVSLIGLGSVGQPTNRGFTGYGLQPRQIDTTGVGRSY